MPRIREWLLRLTGEADLSDARREVRQLEGDLRDAAGEADDLGQELDDVGTAGSNAAGGLGGLGTALAGLGLASVLTEAGSTALELENLAAASGLSTTELDGLLQIIQARGGDIGDLEGLVLGASTAFGELSEATGPAYEQLQRLNIDIDQFLSLDFQGRLQLITQRTGELDLSQQDLFAIMSALFGDADAAFAIAIAQSDELAVNMGRSEESIAGAAGAARDVNAAFADLKQTTGEVVAELGPLISALAEVLRLLGLITGAGFSAADALRNVGLNLPGAGALGDAIDYLDPTTGGFLSSPSEPRPVSPLASRAGRNIDADLAITTDSERYRNAGGFLR